MKEMFSRNLRDRFTGPGVHNGTTTSQNRVRSRYEMENRPCFLCSDITLPDDLCPEAHRLIQGLENGNLSDLLDALEPEA